MVSLWQIHLEEGEPHYGEGPYCPVCHCFWNHGPRCEGIGWRDGEGEPIEDGWYEPNQK